MIHGCKLRFQTYYRYVSDNFEEPPLNEGLRSGSEGIEGAKVMEVVSRK